MLRILRHRSALGLGAARSVNLGYYGMRSKHTDATLAHVTWLDPLARHLLVMPETLGLVGTCPYPYTTFIVGMTLILRLVVSVPTVAWQRRRNDKFTQIMLPEWAVWKRQIPAAALSRHARQQDISKEKRVQLHREIHCALTEKWKHLIKLHDCSPLRTTLTSLAVHIPLFILVSMLLQKGAIMGDSVLAHEIVPWWSPDATVAAQASASQQILQEKGLDPELVRRLTQIGGPTLADTDPTRIMPVAVGALNMANVEIGNWTRQRRRAKEHALGLGSAPKSNEGSAEPGPEPEPEPLRSRVLSTVLRAGAVISIPIATQVPAVLLVYWATSACATFAQNMYFARKEAE